MPLILVVTKDDRVPGRVREALGPGGWNVAHVHGLTEAMQEVASEAPDLFLVAAELDGADGVLASFARRQGGPGTIALLPGKAPDGAAAPAAPRGADAALPRGFETGELRAVVETVLRAGDRPARPDQGEPKLTSQDIFGDLVAEVESEAREFPARPAAAAGPAAAARPPARPGRRGDDDIERKLEQTLSGVLGRATKPKPAAPAPLAPPSPQTPPPSAARPARDADDLDKLISDTLSGLELPGARKKRPAAPPAPPAAAAPPKPSREGFDLEDFQALLDRPRRAPRTPAAGPPQPPPEAPPAPQAPPSAEAPREEVPFQPRFADAMEEVPDEEPPAAAAEPDGAAAPERPAAPGTEFGQYRLLERIGVGGMAEVWKARMTGVEGFQKTVAIKRILPHLTDSSDFVEMFVDEAKLAAQLNHANIIHIYDLGKLGEDYYIAMEHVEGENLRRILQRARETGRPLPVGLALFVAARLASALDHAHRKRDFDDRELGLVHRDVSPQNVLVGYEGTIKLCDFGIVKAVSKSSHTQRGALKGKLQYMSPEQAWGRPVDGRSDIFSLGALLFEMLTGRRLFVGESEMEVLEAVRECQVAPPSELEPGVPPEVDEVVLAALRSDPDERFQSAGELARRLEELLAGMRPAPGQGELAAYMAGLFDRAPAEKPAEAAAAPAEPPAETGQPPRAETSGAPLPGAGAATVPIPVQTAKAAAEAPTGTGTSTGTGTGTGTGAGAATGGAVQAVEPVGKVEPEEGGRPGLWLLVAAVVAALVLGGVLAWYFVLGPGRAEEAGGAQPPPAAEEGEAPAEVPAPAVPPGEGGEEEAAAAEGEAGGAEGEAAGSEDLPLDIEERLAEREEALRRQFEAELTSREQELQERLSELRDAPAEEPPPPAAKAPAPQPAPAPAPSSAKAPPPQEAAAKSGAAAAAAPRDQPEEPDVEEVSAPQEAVPAPAPRPAPPPPPAPRAQPKAPPEPAVREGELVSMGPGVVAPKLVRFEKPEYPPIARRLRAEGEVVISLLVDETGRVTEARVVQRASQDAGLEEAALEAARSATYQPATKDGVRVKMWTTLRIPFRL